MDTTLRKPYDFFQSMDRLTNHADELTVDERRALKAAVVLNAADPRAVALHVDLTGDRLGELYPPNAEEPPVTTNDAIDTFLDRYGHTSPEEDAMLEKLIFNPVPDYSSVLAAESATETEINDDPAALAALAADINGAPMPASDDEIIIENLSESSADVDDASKTKELEKDKNVAKESRVPKKENQPNVAPKRSALTFELAKIFIKQGQFDRAYEIISKISLNNPKKSAYFADQLRFLEKLMLIQRASGDKKG